MSKKLLIGIGLVTAFAGAAPAVLAQHYNNTVECQSRDFRFSRCGVYWGDARLVQQTSDARCSRGYSWGVDRKGLWVDKGCGGVFRDAGHGAAKHHDGGYGGGYSGGGGDWHPGPDWDSEFAFRCKSRDYGYTFCAVDLGAGGRARIVGQASNTACIEGRTWGYNRAGVWVDGGCEGDFTITRRWR